MLTYTDHIKHNLSLLNTYLMIVKSMPSDRSYFYKRQIIRLLSETKDLIEEYKDINRQFKKVG
jgi:hypothetical protein